MIMETNEIQADNIGIAVKAINVFSMAAKGVIDALYEVVKNRGGEVKVNQFIQMNFGDVKSTVQRILIKDDFLCVEHEGMFGKPIQTCIVSFEYDFLTLCSLLTYAATS